MSGYTWRGRPPVNPCACGCGGEAPIATRTDLRPDHRQVKGQPLRYIKGHNPKNGKSPVPSAADLGHTGPRPRRGNRPAQPPRVHVLSPRLPGLIRTGCGITRESLDLPVTADPSCATCAVCVRAAS
jgi:hypothetical protein